MGSSNLAGSSRPNIREYESKWASAEALTKLSKSDYMTWTQLRYVIRPYCYFNKIFIGWTLQHGVPSVKDVFTVVGLDVSFQEGVWVRLRSATSAREVIINHTPRKLPNVEVFMWTPFVNEFRYAGPDWEDPNSPKHLRISSCLRMQHGPEFLEEGADYVWELHEFRHRFPQFKDTRF